MNGLDVYGVGAGGQGRKGKRLVVGRIGVENVSVGNPRVDNRKIAGGSDARVCSCGGGSAKNPEGLVGGAVLARIDADGQLRLGVVPPPQMQTTAANKDSFRFIESSLLSKISSFLISQKKRVKHQIHKKVKKNPLESTKSAHPSAKRDEKRNSGWENS